MGTAISAFNSMFSAMNRIDAGNRIFSNNNAMTQNVAAVSRQAMAFGSQGMSMQPIISAQQTEKNLMASNLQNNLLYKIAMLQEENETKKSKKKLDYMA